MNKIVPRRFGAVKDVGAGFDISKRASSPSASASSAVSASKSASLSSSSASSSSSSDRFRFRWGLVGPGGGPVVRIGWTQRSVRRSRCWLVMMLRSWSLIPAPGVSVYPKARRHDRSQSTDWTSRLGHRRFVLPCKGMRRYDRRPRSFRTSTTLLLTLAPTRQRLTRR